MTRIYRQVPRYAFESLRFQFQAKARGRILKFAVPVLGTMGAIEVMMAEKKLEGGIPEPFDFWGIQVDNHAITDRLSAGGDRGASAFDFHEAETAGSKRRNGFSYSA